MVTTADDDFMARALFHAARGRGRTTPNPMVGAVVVSGDGIVVGQGYHARAGGPHAEICALDQAGGRARGGTLYCTLEPCVHTGRTGPCVPRIVDAGIVRVVASVEDPNPLVCGRGFRELRARGVQVDIGAGGDEAAALNQPFFTSMAAGRPFVVLKAAISSDGRIAEARGRRTNLTSAAADRHAQRFRAEVDAIGVGVDTVVCDDPLLTPRGAFPSRALNRGNLETRLRTPPAAQVLSTAAAGPVIIVTTPEAASDEGRRRPLEARGATMLVCDGTVQGAAAALGRLGITSLLLEGGAKLHEAAWNEGVVDLVRLYVAPRALGASGVPFLDGRRLSTALLAHRRVRPLGPDVLIEGYVHGPR
jgi:diaminohydroxyphosphoribosylaminopyrimidine deaminase/5-amino-6-(5-phosphoribosylamino)uracil reductase